MTMPHKICPQCGQPAVLEMAQCRRCGFAYMQAPSVGSPYVPGTQRDRERPYAPQQPPTRRRSGARLLLAALGCLLIVGALARVLMQGTRRHASAATGGLPFDSGLNIAPADADAPPGKFALFAESESRQETPSLTFRNWSGFTMTLTLRDQYGHVYRSSCAGDQTAEMQVPAGYYSVSLDCDNPHVRPNWGEATFRKFKTYRADFGVGVGGERLHLGE